MLNYEFSDEGSIPSRHIFNFWHMKVHTHPFLIETKIQFKDGSIYKKRWQFFRTTLPLEVDSNSQFLWKKEYNRQEKILINKTNKIKN